MQVYDLEAQPHLMSFKAQLESGRQKLDDSEVIIIDSLRMASTTNSNISTMHLQSIKHFLQCHSQSTQNNYPTVETVRTKEHGDVDKVTEACQSTQKLLELIATVHKSVVEAQKLT